MSTQLNNVNDDSTIIALAFNSGYAMPGAVTLRSVAEHVRGRVTVYIVDCGLRAEDKAKVEASLLIRSDITLLFVNLPPDSVASKLGPAWARVDVMRCLPAERVIYLDADTLVRKDLRELWRTDLSGHAIAAAPDLWCPMGHDRIPRGEYFNSGVLLLDLVKIRSTFPALEALCYEMKDALFWDQDPLNIHFRGDRLWLSLTWNAHGIGTVAEWPDPERQKLPLEQLNDPAIVHFTGPVHPFASSVLHPYLRPTQAKPWGFGGAPGNPYEKEWWEMLEKTVWKGLRQTTEYKEICEEAKVRAWNNAEEEFNRKIDAVWSCGPPGPR